MSSTAFEVTHEDVLAVMANSGNPVTIEKAEEVFEAYIAKAGGRIEKAALYGDGIDEQTTYAHQEIAAILRENDVLHRDDRAIH